MSKKRLTIILLIIVVVVWTTIGYKLFHALKGYEQPYSAATITKKREPVFDYANYKIANYEKDPFLSIITDTVTQIEEPVRFVTPKPVPRNMPEYNGLIVNAKFKRKTAIIHWQGQFNMMYENEFVNGVRLVRANDSIATIILDGEKYELKRK